MLRYDRQTKPGLVTLYNIRPGNGAGPYLQPRSPHGADNTQSQVIGSMMKAFTALILLVGYINNKNI